jgi:hypothetical protein
VNTPLPPGGVNVPTNVTPGNPSNPFTPGISPNSPTTTTNPNPDPIDPCASANPCTSKIAKALDDLLQDSGLETVTIIRFLRCDGATNEPKFDEVDIQVVKGTGLKEQIFASSLADIQAQKCKTKESEPIALAMPEWWQLRPEAQRPQIAVIFREIRADQSLGNDYYSINIPHPKSIAKPSRKILPDYIKGNWQTLLTLNDNSKVIINTLTQGGGTSLMNSIKGLIDPNQLTKATIKQSHYPDHKFSEIVVTNFQVDYFAQGVKFQATWRAKVK